MRPASLGIVFSMLFLSFLLVSDHRTAALQETGLQKIMYNNCLDSAVEDAIEESVELDEGQEIQLNKEKIVDDFFTALAVNFDGMENPEKRRLLQACVPAAAFIERDKVTFFYGFLEEPKTKEVFFQKKIGNYQVHFTLTDYAVVENLQDGKVLEGDFHDIGKIFQEKIFSEEDWFYEEQKKVIQQAVTENMEKIIAEHNEAASKLGISYHFQLPVIKEEEWYRGIDGISMLVFFQGYPYGNGMTGYYNRTAIGGAEIKK